MILNGTGERLDAYDYPATTEDIIAEYGDRELTLQNGTETVREILERLDTETFETPEDARFALYGAVSDKAIGRKHYSDRDPTPLGAPNAPDALSF